MLILGINEDHNATAALCKDGKIIACCSEERLSRVKNDVEYPYKSIDSILKISGTAPSEIDFVAFAGTQADCVQMKIKRSTRYKISDYIKEMHQYWKKLFVENIESDYWESLLSDPRFASVPKNYYDYGFMDKFPKEQWQVRMNEARQNAAIEQLGIKRERARFIDHHTAHAHYAYYASPREGPRPAAIVTADGWGDGCNATISKVEDGKIREVFRTPMCNLARIYRWMTLLLGMKPNEHEYKVMGLAPYAKDYLREPAYKIFKESLIVDGIDFKWKNKPSDMYFYFKDKFEGTRFDAIAAGLQLWVEELLSEWITNVMAFTKAEALYYSGGLSMNVKANMVIAGLPAVKAIHIPPSGGDESLAMGAAFALSKEFKEEQSPLPDAYLGFSPSKESSLGVIKKLINNPNFQVIHDPDDTMLAQLLWKGKVLGRCVGKMEFGARSLGNRAVLCDPSKYENIRVINEKIKFRDFWMPFTPSILAERADDYIYNPKKLRAEFMTIAFHSTPLAREHLRAAIHPYDFTVRPQLVRSKVNPRYYSLIKAFEKISGIGALLNTSLNLHGNPIACTETDAVEVLINSGLDGLILPGAAILKK